MFAVIIIYSDIRDVQGIKHRMLIEEFNIMYLCAYIVCIDTDNVNSTDTYTGCNRSVLFVRSYYVRTNTTFVPIKMYKYL